MVHFSLVYILLRLMPVVVFAGSYLLILQSSSRRELKGKYFKM